MSSSSVELLERAKVCGSWKETAVFLSPKKASLSFSNGRPSCPLALSSLLLAFAAAIAVALLLVLRMPPPSPGNPYVLQIYEDQERITLLGKKMQSHVSGTRILDSIRWIAEEVHVAGTPENEKLLRTISDEYKRLGYDVRIFEYNVLLSYPDYTKPNTIDVFDDESKEWLRVSEGFGKAKLPENIHDQISDSRANVWWSAYSANGTVEGKVVYVNYGRAQDFESLKAMKVSMKGAIAFMRFGGVSRSMKVAEAERHGAIGVILFSDPIHTGPGSGNQSFPTVMALPGDDVQRGGLLRTVGDPETPFLPSLPYVPRESNMKLRRSGVLPKIPVTPVGSDTASRLMRLLDGPVVQEQRWHGNLAADYRISSTRKFRLSVISQSLRKPIHNIVATWKGSVEPDRWVMLGNHIDAWVKGAIDPATGTATQLEVARVMAEGARLSPPKRSLVFCHWDAEEFGLIGSSEWIEHFRKVINARAVAMINIDHIGGNSTLQVKAVPLLYKILTEAAESVEQIDEYEKENGRETLLDSWKYHGHRGPIEGERSLPEMGLPGGASDHQRFISLGGVPCADVKMTSRRRSSYALYHSMHEVPWSVEQFISPDGSALATVAKFITETLHRLANHVVIPFSVTHYSQALTQWMTNLHNHLERLSLNNNLPSYELRFRAMFSAARKFRDVAATIDAFAAEISSGHRGVSLPVLSRINERLLLLERIFIDSHGVHSQLHKHLVFSPSIEATTRSPFAIVIDAAHNWQTASSTNKDVYLEEISAAFALITLALENAAELLAIDDLHVPRVIFALKVLCNSYTPEDVLLMGWFPIPSRYACWAELAIIQMVTPNASFVGHLGGILAGLAFTMGPLRWVTEVATAIFEGVLGIRGDDEVEQPRYADGHRWGSGRPTAPADEGTTWGEVRSGYSRPTAFQSGYNRPPPSENDSAHRRPVPPTDYHAYTGGLSEEEQLRLAMEESTRHRRPYGWSID